MGDNLEHNLRSIAGLRPTWAGLTEQDAGRVTTFLRIKATVGALYRILSHDRGGHSQECPILFKRTRRIFWRITRNYAIQISDDLGEAGIANDRWMNLVEAERRGIWRRRSRPKLLLIWTHWNAAIQDRRTGDPLTHLPRWQAMNDKAGPFLEAAIRSGQAEGRDVIVGGDFNYRVGAKSGNWYYAPENIFKRCRMKFHHEGLDYLAWSRGLRHDGVHVVMPNPSNPQALNRSDHPWLYADFEWVK